ncbi:MAG: formylmethanofuran dehydrogenase subunit C [Fimbriiglobus sp.]|jgi:formylmethanofuran dehydrogenase subunit C|nr:formylmethanofuran dehydrogenase subunit C [Fimbriiglobus sp.]
MGFKLTLRSPSPIPLEVDGIVPERLANLSALEVAKQPVRHGNRIEPLGEHFVVSAAGIGDIQFAGDTGNVHAIGRGMTSGLIYVENNAGRHAGAQMSGGQLIVDNGCGDWLGAEMRGGRIEVRGTAGDCVGAAYRGSRRGMIGGSILLLGNAGHELGLMMRRGLIVVEGNTGEFAGASMIAGTLVVKGHFGRRAGAGMKRGTLLALGGVEELSPGFRFCCDYLPAYLGLLTKSLNLPAVKRVKCYRGDALTGGQGELFLANGGP